MLLATFKRLLNDEAGFVVSAELILVATITVLSMVVGLSEVAIGINNELEDVGAAFGSINQSFCFHGVRSQCGCDYTAGSSYVDKVDFCDSDCNIVPGEVCGEQGTN